MKKKQTQKQSRDKRRKILLSTLLPVSAAVVATSIAVPLVLSRSKDVIINPESADNVDISKTEMVNGSMKVTLKSKVKNDKVIDVTVTKGGQVLKNITDYTYNKTSQTLTIKKKALEKYPGQIIINPVMESEGAFSVIGGANIKSKTTLSNGDVQCVLQPDEDGATITSLDSVVKGEHTLVPPSEEDSEYTWDKSSYTLVIAASAMQTYKGDVTITVTTVAPVATIERITATCSCKTTGSVINTTTLNVKGKYTGSSKEVTLLPGTPKGYTIKDYTEIKKGKDITSQVAGSGYTLSKAGTYTLCVFSVENPEKYQTLSVVIKDETPTISSIKNVAYNGATAAGSLLNSSNLTVTASFSDDQDRNLSPTTGYKIWDITGGNENEITSLVAGTGFVLSEPETKYDFYIESVENGNVQKTFSVTTDAEKAMDVDEWKAKLLESVVPPLTWPISASVGNSGAIAGGKSATNGLIDGNSESNNNLIFDRYVCNYMATDRDSIKNMVSFFENECVRIKTSGKYSYSFDLNGYAIIQYFYQSTLYGKMVIKPNGLLDTLYLKGDTDIQNITYSTSSVTPAILMHCIGLSVFNGECDYIIQKSHTTKTFSFSIDNLIYTEGESITGKFKLYLGSNKIGESATIKIDHTTPISVVIPNIQSSSVSSTTEAYCTLEFEEEEILTRDKWLEAYGDMWSKSTYPTYVTAADGDTYKGKTVTSGLIGYSSILFDNNEYCYTSFVNGSTGDQLETAIEEFEGVVNELYELTASDAIYSVDADSLTETFIDADGNQVGLITIDNHGCITRQYIKNDRDLHLTFNTDYNFPFWSFILYDEMLKLDGAQFIMDPDSNTIDLGNVTLDPEYKDDTALVKFSAVGYNQDYDEFDIGETTNYISINKTTPTHITFNVNKNLITGNPDPFIYIELESVSGKKAEFISKVVEWTNNWIKSPKIYDGSNIVLYDNDNSTTYPVNSAWYNGKNLTLEYQYSPTVTSQVIVANSYYQSFKYLLYHCGTDASYYDIQNDYVSYNDGYYIYTFNKDGLITRLKGDTENWTITYNGEGTNIPNDNRYKFTRQFIEWNDAWQNDLKTYNTNQITSFTVDGVDKKDSINSISIENYGEYIGYIYYDNGENSEMIIGDEDFLDELYNSLKTEDGENVTYSLDSSGIEYTNTAATEEWGSIAHLKVNKYGFIEALKIYKNQWHEFSITYGGTPIHYDPE